VAPAFQEVDESRLVPRFADREYRSAIQKVCRELDIDVVYPLNDGEINRLVKFRCEMESAGTHVAVLDSAQVAICDDKWKTFHFFRQLGLPAPASWLPADLPAAREREFPLFIKPRRGSAGEGTFRINNETQLEFFCEYVDDPIVQEYLPGPEITTDVVCSLKGEVLATVSRRRISIRGGEAIKSVTVFDERVDQGCRKIAQNINACGPLTIQCMMKEGVPHFIEINARLGGGVPLAMAADVDVPALLLADLAGVDSSHLNRNATLGLYMTRCDESFFLMEQQVEQTQSGHL